MISTITPAGLKPARRAKSIADSVCPVLLKTPPLFAIKGKICPGRLKDQKEMYLRSTNALTVRARSEADIPVVTPFPLRSTETVNAVSIGSVLFDNHSVPKL